VRNTAGMLNGLMTGMVTEVLKKLMVHWSKFPMSCDYIHKPIKLKKRWKTSSIYY
jgi:hypothetical protein